jgi:hypothetical protein
LPKQGKNSAYIPVFVETPKYPLKGLKKRQRKVMRLFHLQLPKVVTVREPVLVEESPEKMGFGKAAMKVAKKIKVCSPDQRWQSR